MVNLLNSSVGFPSPGGIQGVVLWLLGNIYGWVGVYGIAIILFTIIIKLVFVPLDFGNRYFQKMNSLKMAEMKPEQEMLAQIHAGDPIAYNRARQQLMAKHSHGMMGFCVFMLLSMGLSIVVFFSVFQALGSMSGFNANQQFIELRQVVQPQFQIVQDEIATRRQTYQNSFQAGAINQTQLTENLNALNTELDERLALIAEDFFDEINEVYEDTRVSFLWIHNMWRADTMWTRRTLTASEFYDTASGTQYSVFRNSDHVLLSEAERRDIRGEYDAIFAQIEQHGRALNGWLILVVFAGCATFGSSFLMAKHQKASMPQKKPEEEDAGTYSVRAAKQQPAASGGSAPPAFDPQQMGKMMKYMMPALMIVVSLTMTAAMALYIVVSQLMTVALSLAMTPLIEKLIKRSRAKKKEAEIDETLINPHAKFFKTKHKD